jgi:hypothetical protein
MLTNRRVDAPRWFNRREGITGRYAVAVIAVIGLVVMI